MRSRSPSRLRSDRRSCCLRPALHAAGIATWSPLIATHSVNSQRRCPTQSGMWVFSERMAGPPRDQAFGDLWRKLGIEGTSRSRVPSRDGDEIEAQQPLSIGATVHYRPIPARRASRKLPDAWRWLFVLSFHEAAVRDLTHPAISCRRRKRHKPDMTPSADDRTLARWMADCPQRWSHWRCH